MCTSLLSRDLIPIKQSEKVQSAGGGLSLGDYFLRVLMFDILWIGPKTQNFVPAIISYMHYSIL